MGWVGGWYAIHTTNAVGRLGPGEMQQHEYHGRGGEPRHATAERGRHGGRRGSRRARARPRPAGAAAALPRGGVDDHSHP
jgi:hypothetical protein